MGKIPLQSRNVRDFGRSKTQNFGEDLTDGSAMDTCVHTRVLLYKVSSSPRIVC